MPVCVCGSGVPQVCAGSQPGPSSVREDLDQKASLLWVLNWWGEARHWTRSSATEGSCYNYSKLWGVCVCVCVFVRKCLQGLWSYETMESSETEVGGRGWLRGTRQGLPLLVNRSKQVPVSLDCVIWRPGTRLRDTQYGKGLIAHCCLFTGLRWFGRAFLFNIQLAHTVARVPIAVSGASSIFICSSSHRSF